jgi:hypothetical protein
MDVLYKYRGMEKVQNPGVLGYLNVNKNKALINTLTSEYVKPPMSLKI